MVKKLVFAAGLAVFAFHAQRPVAASWPLCSTVDGTTCFLLNSTKNCENDTTGATEECICGQGVHGKVWYCTF